MTNQYIQYFHTAKCFSFFRIVFWCKGSVYRKLIPHFIFFAVAYTILSLWYRYLMTQSERVVFEKWVTFVNEILDLVPIILLLGFYIRIVFNRFWFQYLVIPWCFNIALAIASHLRHGEKANKETARQMRRTLIRYINVAFLILFMKVSEPIMKKFKNLETLVEVNMLTNEEKMMLDEVKNKENLFFVPLLWSLGIMRSARKKKFMTNCYGYVNLIQKYQDYHDMCRQCLVMDTVCLPLVYTQVVTVTVYTYLLLCIVGRQYIDENSAYNISKTFDFYIPVLTALELFIYIGCLKYEERYHCRESAVIEAMISLAQSTEKGLFKRVKLTEELLNPMGENDDDFDMLYIYNTCLRTSMYIIEMHEQGRADIKKISPDAGEIPHTQESLPFKTPPAMGSISDVETPLRIHDIFMKMFGTITGPKPSSAERVGEDSETCV